MEKPHPWMKVHPWMSSMSGKGSSMDAMDGEMSFVDESVISGCHPWMTSTDGDDG